MFYVEYLHWHVKLNYNHTKNWGVYNVLHWIPPLTRQTLLNYNHTENWGVNNVLRWIPPLGGRRLLFTFKDCTLENTCNVIQGQLYVIGLVVGTRMHFKIIANKTGNWTQCQVTPKIL